MKRTAYPSLLDLLRVRAGRAAAAGAPDASLVADPLGWAGRDVQYVLDDAPGPDASEP